LADSARKLVRQQRTDGEKDVKLKEKEMAMRERELQLKEKKMAMQEAQFARDAKLNDSKIALNNAQLVESQVRTEWLHFQMDQGKRKSAGAPQTMGQQKTTTTAMGRTVQKKT
jgi:hypothetical protein